MSLAVTSVIPDDRMPLPGQPDEKVQETPIASPASSFLEVSYFFTTLNFRQFGDYFIRFAANGNLTQMRLMASQRSISHEILDPAIVAALENGHLDVAAEWMNETVSPKIRGAAVIQAAQAGDLKLLQAWLPHRMMIPAICLGNAIQKAAAGGHLEMVRFLLLQGDIFDEDRQAAIALSRERYPEIAALLARCGCCIIS
jgi:hypothetical protein